MLLTATAWHAACGTLSEGCSPIWNPLTVW